ARRVLSARAAGGGRPPGGGFSGRARGGAPGGATPARPAAREPLALCGTSFAFVPLLDRLEARGASLALPAGTRVMETGGFKGRSRELSRDELHGAIEARLGVPRASIVNQYGMCELASQFYEPTLGIGRITDL